MKLIMQGGGYEPNGGRLSTQFLRGTATEIKELVDKLIIRFRGGGYDLIVVDSIYSLLGPREENSNEDITDLGTHLQRLAKTTGAGIIFIHHFSKGKQTDKRGIEKSSGAGAWGRFPDASLAIDKHPSDFCFNFEVTSRTFPDQDPFVARRENGIWVPQAGVKVTQKAEMDTDITGMLHVLQNEGRGRLAPKAWYELCVAKLGLSEKRYRNRVNKARETGLIMATGNTRNTVYQLAEGVSWHVEEQQYRA